VAHVQIRNLTIEYAQSGYVVRPIEQLDADAGDGELVLLLGPSGCGKTTLLSCLAGILTPSRGTITVGDSDLTALSHRELARYRRDDVGIVFQAFNLIASLSARENVAAPLRLAGVSKAKATRRAEELLERVGLSDRTHHAPQALSGGQQQRVAIARALVFDPPLIVADEPTAHLDYVQVEGVLRFLRELATAGRVVIVATHDHRFTPLADRVIDLTPQMGHSKGCSETVELAAGEVLFEQGAMGELIYVVDEGEMEVFRRDAEGDEIVLSTIGPGSYFGELGPLLSLPRAASARARRPTKLTGYPLNAFRAMQRSADAGRQLR
jgi:putative ABC transport system ATP-binding protein